MVAAHEGPLTKSASVVLPATSWAEHAGTYVNAKGFRQVAEKGLEPLGDSRPAWKVLADVAAALGFEASWSKLKQIRVAARRQPVRRRAHGTDRAPGRPGGMTRTGP